MVRYSKNRILSLILVALLIAPAVGAASIAGEITEAEFFKTPENSAPEDELFAELSTQVELYNENFNNVPSLVKRLAASEEIAGKIKLNNGEMLYVTLLMRGGKVGEFYRYDTPNDPNSRFGPSITIESDEDTVRGILDSNDTLRKAVEKMNEGTLKVEAKGIFRKSVLWSIQQLYS